MKLAAPRKSCKRKNVSRRGVDAFGNHPGTRPGTGARQQIAKVATRSLRMATIPPTKVCDGCTNMFYG